MKLKGTMVLELTDTNTGEVERVEETNMLTNAVNHILGLNPMCNTSNYNYPKSVPNAKLFLYLYFSIEVIRFLEKQFISFVH